MQDLMPQGLLVAGSNFRKLISGFDAELNRINDFFDMFYKEYNPSITQKMLDYWMKSLGLPDDVLGDETYSDDFMRKYIVAKIAKMNLTTTQDWINLASWLGYQVTIEPYSQTGLGWLPLTLPFIPMNVDEIPYTLKVTIYNVKKPESILPATLPFILGDIDRLIERLFKKLKPAHITLIFIYEYT